MDMGRGEEMVRCMTSHMETYITICKIDRNLLHASGNSNRGSVST